MNIELPFDNDDRPISVKYDVLLNDWKEQNKNIKRLCRLIKKKNRNIRQLQEEITKLKKKIRNNNYGNN